MRRIKHPKLGEWCLVAKWSDKDPGDAWHFGPITSVEKHINGSFYYTIEGADYPKLRYCWRLSQEELNNAHKMVCDRMMEGGDYGLWREYRAEAIREGYVFDTEELDQTWLNKQEAKS